MPRLSAWLVLSAAALLCLSGCARPVVLGLEPTQWDFGTIPPAAAIEQTIRVTNPGRGTAAVRLISTCACLTIEPAVFELAGGAGAGVLLRYDPSEDQGDIRMQIIIRSGEGRGAGRQVFEAFGRVLPGPASGSAAVAEEPQLRVASPELPQFLFQYYYDPGCKGCEVLLVRQMVAAQQALGIRLRVERHPISEPQEHQEYLRRLKALGVEERAYPALVFGDTVLQGDREIEGQFTAVLRRALDNEGARR